jgi:hypothetical protein
VKDGFLVTPLTCFLPLIGDADALHRALGQDPGQWLPDNRHLGEGRWTMELHGARMTRTVVAMVGRAWWAGTTQWRALSWEPLGDPEDPERVAKLLPSLDGELGLHTSGDTVSLVLDARYRPPGGPLGAALDAIGLHRVARTTVDRLLADIGERLVAIADAEEPRSAGSAVPDTDTMVDEA